jgi:SAM-dependent methyltransferase
MLIFIFQLVSFLILLFVLSLMLFWMWSSMKAKIPFIRVPVGVLGDIEKALDLKEGSVVYDLGCGDGLILFYLAKRNPNIKYVGIENSPFPALIARFMSFWHRKINNVNVEILKKDFFDVNLSEATHIVTYLFPNVMDDVLPKLDVELKKGTRLVSASFHFTSKREISVVELKRKKYQLAHRIYIYEF